MNIVYSNMVPPMTWDTCIFLAGPTCRWNPESILGIDLTHWRKAALDILEMHGYEGTVLVPETTPGDPWPDFSVQYDWEIGGLNAADVILFWVPRVMKNEMPALTTNIEWGKFQKSGKVVLGFPNNAEHVRYLEKDAAAYDVPVFHTLEETIVAALKKLNPVSPLGAVNRRTAGETQVPLQIWRTPHFQAWYQAHLAVGNHLESCRAEYVLGVGPGRGLAFLFVLHVNVWIAAEKRYKSNEVLVCRSDLASVLMYCPYSDNIMDTEVVLVKEFRSPVSNKQCMVYELPGGSAAKMTSFQDLAVHEVEEETGIVIDPKRLHFHQTRQLNATLSTHHSYLGSVLLNKDEMEDVKKAAQRGDVHGVEADTERTYLEVRTVGSLLGNDDVDFAGMGMILSALLELLSR